MELLPSLTRESGTIPRAARSSGQMAPRGTAVWRHADENPQLYQWERRTIESEVSIISLPEVLQA